MGDDNALTIGSPYIWRGIFGSYLSGETLIESYRRKSGSIIFSCVFPVNDKYFIIFLLGVEVIC